MRLLTIVLVVVVAAGVPSPAHAVTDLLPALQPVRSDLAKYDFKKTKGGKVLLRFVGSIGNHGRGELHVRGAKDARDTEMTAYQRISRSDGSTREVRIGKLVFHAEHHHYHLDGVSRYRLIAPGGDVVREAPKVTFCLMDTEPIDRDLEGFSARPVYHQCAPSASASKAHMGISVGWKDVYDKETPGQSFDVTELTKLEPKEYTLEMTINPKGMLRESGRGNTVSVKVKIGRGIGPA